MPLPRLIYRGTFKDVKNKASGRGVENDKASNEVHPFGAFRFDLDFFIIFTYFEHSFNTNPEYTEIIKRKIFSQWIEKR